MAMGSGLTASTTGASSMGGMSTTGAVSTNDATTNGATNTTGASDTTGATTGSAGLPGTDGSITTDGTTGVGGSGGSTVGIPCGEGWGGDAIPGSVELGLASNPEILGVSGGLADERAIFDQINQQRELNGLLPLIWSDQVANVARSHAADMNQLDYFDHGSLERPYRDDEGNAIRDNWLPHPRLEFVYPGDFDRAGENIASYRDPVDNVVDAWMDSDGHRAAILDEYGWTATHGAVGLDGNMAVFSPATCAR